MSKRDSGKGDTDIENDAALWARIAQTATPLKKKNRVAKVAAIPKPAQPPKAKVAKEKAANAQAKPVPTPAPKPPSRPGHAPGAGGLDRQTARKLEKGALAVEARLDLHGMRQRDAHVALSKFLKWAQGKDYRHVLVITGKGSLRDEGGSFYEEEARGVLRQAVPHWLSHGDLAPLIVSFAEAPRRLGGEGALYVRLRKLRPK
jgi:DNA-nicking Smr family endonuclease